jgi:hypothetical protein
MPSDRPRKYAEGTDVPVARSREELRRLLRDAGATGIALGEEDTAGGTRHTLLFELRAPSGAARRISYGFVFPTRVGVFRMRSFLRICCAGLPHACGGVPAETAPRVGAAAFSPRVWGCS